MSNKYFETSLPNLKLPTTRAAYSDRTAWLMAEMSALAYERFEGEQPLQKKIDSLTTKIRIACTIKKFFCSFTKKNSNVILERIDELENTLKEFIASESLEKKHPNESLANFQKHISEAGFSLVKTFNLNDTQAFLAKRDEDKTAVLAFRGTEANSWKDIKADLMAWTKKSAGGTKTHTGFADAYLHVKAEVEAAVSSTCREYALYITGHSLGGALSILAAKELEGKEGVTIAACYTFGSPRVGNQELGEKIKAPVYRIVNAADGVPLVPAGGIVRFIIPFLRLRLLPFFHPLAKCLEDNWSGYIHFGDQRHLTACNEEMSNLKLLSNPTFLTRLKNRFCKSMSRMVLASGRDHKISLYRKKLRRYAEKRNN